MNRAVFCDFDGTVTRHDVGYRLFHHFSRGKTDELIPDWKSGRLSTRECLVKEAAMVKAAPDEVYAFLDQFELNPGFPEFVNLCQASHVKLSIISDGLDFYIEHILKRHGLLGIPFLANAGRLENNRVKVEFPHANHSCDRCGNCKGERIQEYRRQQPGETLIVFVGDGYSDICATREADLIFAKKDLEEYCAINNIDYVGYDSFFDVSRCLSERGYLID